MLGKEHGKSPIKPSQVPYSVCWKNQQGKKLHHGDRKPWSLNCHLSSCHFQRRGRAPTFRQCWYQHGQQWAKAVKCYIVPGGLSPLQPVCLHLLHQAQVNMLHNSKQKRGLQSWHLGKPIITINSDFFLWESKHSREQVAFGAANLSYGPITAAGCQKTFP